MAPSRGRKGEITVTSDKVSHEEEWVFPSELTVGQWAFLPSLGLSSDPDPMPMRIEYTAEDGEGAAVAVRDTSGRAHVGYIPGETVLVATDEQVDDAKRRGLRKTTADRLAAFAQIIKSNPDVPFDDTGVWVQGLSRSQLELVSDTLGLPVRKLYGNTWSVRWPDVDDVDAFYVRWTSTEKPSAEEAAADKGAAQDGGGK